MENGKKQITVEYITHYKLSKERPTAWVRIDNIRLNEGHTQGFVWNYKGLDQGKTSIKPLTLDEYAAFNGTDGWRIFSTPIRTKSSEDLWVNAKGEFYCIKKARDPWMYVTSQNVSPLYTLSPKELSLLSNPYNSFPSPIWDIPSESIRQL